MEARVSDVTLHVPNIKPEDKPDVDWNYVDISSICNQTFQIRECRTFPGKDAPSRARRPIQPGDIIFSNVRTYLRNIALVPYDTKAQVCSTGFTVLRPNSAVVPKYLFRFVLSEHFIRRVTPQQTGTHYPAISDKVVMAERIPLPPLAEQRRIVAKLELVLARVDACRKRLDRIPLLLKRFHHAVLEAACSGRLTEQWRKANRREDWASWTLSDVVEDKPKNGYSAKPARTATPWRILTLTATTSGRFDARHFKYVEEEIPTNSPLWLRSGDILVQRGNTIEYVGVPAIYHGADRAFIYPDLMMRFRANDKVRTAYLYYVLSWGRSRNFLRERATGTAGNMPKINQGTLLSLPVEVPSLSEQDEIIRRVESLFKLADRIEERYHLARAQVDKLTQSILAKAFRGDLVPQDPDDEPASALLDGIRSERERRPAASPRGGRGRKVKA